MSLIKSSVLDNNYHLLLRSFINQRRVICEIKKETSLNRSDLEILAYGFDKEFFNAYQVQQSFIIMNVQQSQKSLKKLEELKMIEIIGKGFAGKPKTFTLSYKGETVLNNYLQKLMSA